MIKKETDLALLARKDADFLLSGEAFSGVLKELLLEKKSSVRFCAKGFSMAPFIKDGDIVTIEPVSPECKLNLGDLVIVVKNNYAGKVILHRIAGKLSGLLLIKGDNNREADGFVAVSSVLGKIARVERNGRRVFFGFGPERFLIAFLSRCNLLIPLFFPFRILIRFFGKLF